ncbi:MAG: hypothetical protein NTY86_22655 [Deltaproteobacteria bacterium]|nr:hypothetical protein [Deltaproteobacteria bacterium]
MKALNTINLILQRCASDMSSLPPTVLYNEGWMLRLLLEWFSQQPASGHPLDFTEGSRWYSEALIPSAFLPRKRGDKFAETWTHADGVIGHFEIGKNRVADLTLLPDATTLKVLEAKMLSKLSKGIKHAPYFNQAARNIACIAEILRLAADKCPVRMVSVSFYVIAPKFQIDRGYFSAELSKESIKSIVEKRVYEHDTEHKTDKIKWFQDWFVPTLEKADIQSISWEDILSHLNNVDPDVGNDLRIFYDNCRRYNKIKNADHACPV